MNNYYERSPLSHYYGDVVRKIFLFGALLMLATLPLEGKILATNFLVSILGVLGLTLLAGFTSPGKRWVIVTDVIVSALAFISFEFSAIQTFSFTQNITGITFATQQILAVAFLIALYFSSKTLRGLGNVVE